MTSKSEKYSRSVETLFENIDDETVILNFKDGSYYGLNPSGKILWEALSEPKSFFTLCELLQSDFPDLATADLTQDVDMFLKSLMECELVHVEDLP